MPGRADTTNAQHRAYTPSTLSRCRNEPVFSNKGKQRSASTIPLGREALLRNNVRQNRLVGEQLDPALLRMLLRQPEGEMRQKGGDEQYPPGPVRRLAMNGNPADQLPQENKPPHTFGVAYHGEHGVGDLMGMGSNAMPFGGVVDRHQQWLVRQHPIGQPVGIKRANKKKKAEGLPQSLVEQFKEGNRKRQGTPTMNQSRNQSPSRGASRNAPPSLGADYDEGERFGAQTLGTRDLMLERCVPNTRVFAPGVPAPLGQ